MKKNLLLLTLLFATQANAFNGGLQSTFTPNLDSRELENSVKYDYLKTEIETKRTYANGLSKCALENKYYMPGHGSADSNGCFDVLGYLNNMGLSGQEATYANYVDTDGDFASGVSYSTGYWAADKLCNDKETGSRAARESDLKYFLHDATLPGYSSWFLFETIKKTTGTGDVQAFGYNNWDQTIVGGVQCQKYTNAVSSQYTPILNTTGGGVQPSTLGCDSSNNIMCVFD